METTNQTDAAREAQRLTITNDYPFYLEVECSAPFLHLAPYEAEYMPATDGEGKTKHYFAMRCGTCNRPRGVRWVRNSGMFKRAQFTAACEYMTNIVEGIDDLWEWAENVEGLDPVLPALLSDLRERYADVYSMIAATHREPTV